MIRSILIFLAFLLATVLQAQGQEVSKQLIGKWKLIEVSAAGETYPAEEVFGTPEIYQIYKVKNQFVGLVGDESEKGTWKLTKDKKTIVIQNGTEKTNFTILSMKGTMLLLELAEEEEVLKLKYKKQ